MKNSSVIRQKVESQNGGNKKAKHAKFSEKRTFLTPGYAHIRVRIRGWEMFVFSEIWRALLSCYLLFEMLPFTLLPTNCKSICKKFFLVNLGLQFNWDKKYNQGLILIIRNSFFWTVSTNTSIVRVCDYCDFNYSLWNKDRRRF